jgi:hypothetical protein
MTDTADIYGRCWVCKHPIERHSDVAGCTECACEVLGGQTNGDVLVL